jgi:rhamnose transport system permease protein
VTILRVPSLVVTLGTLYVIRGIDAAWAGGNQIASFSLPDSFNKIGYGTIAGVPYLGLIAIGAVAIATYAMRSFRTGRDFYAIGSNPDAARLSGIPVTRRLMAAFALSGLLAGLGGFMFAARFAGVDATSANGYEFLVVTAVVIGGVNVFGGSGTVLGAMLGAVLVATINDGFTLMRFDEFWKVFFEGAAIVVAVTVDALLFKRLQELLRRRRRPELAHLGAAR